MKPSAVTVASVQREGSKKMEQSKKERTVLLNTVSIILFIACLALTIAPFLTSLFKLGQNTQIAMSFDLPVLYYIASCCFAALLTAMLVFAYIFKNKVMALIPMCYMVLTAIVVLCLFILMSNPNVDIYVIYVAAFSCIAPLYGFCYLTYVWSLFLILPLFFASIIVTVKIFKFEKLQKELSKKKKK